MITVALNFNFYIDNTNFVGYTSSIPLLEDGFDTGMSYFYHVSMKHRSVHIEKFFKSDNEVNLINSVDFIGGMTDVLSWFKDDENILLNVDWFFLLFFIVLFLFVVY